ncbi:hypothetical protein [Hydrogenophaga sp. PAMC20947]|uniref:hypothetical protein n=1 Tax=Hydrogenophaga sp. PAMC20947 TaxID=2565558 RepID=UPI00109DD3E6|nr:hypothetical protein [Hydrogenophaga sp. PAMC20947]QCB47251.1 hypothetical protein E5678_15180 [Hydrogenophaga sp. PAMC20947]
MRNVFHLCASLLIPLGTGCAHLNVDMPQERLSTSDEFSAADADKPKDGSGSLLKVPTPPSATESLPLAANGASLGRTERPMVLNAEGDSLERAPVEASIGSKLLEPEANTSGTRLSKTFPGSSGMNIAPIASPPPIIAGAAVPAIKKDLEKAAGSVERKTEASHGSVAAGNPSVPGQRLEPLVGQIVGLTNGGLVLTDAMGHVLRPRPGALGFRFRAGEAYLQGSDGHQLMVVRQPVGQTCLIEDAKDRSEGQSIRCFSEGDTQAPPVEPVMRDCFQVATRGSAFTLGYQLNGVWQRLVDVAMDPVGIERQQHKTYVNGKLLLEAIIHLPLITPVAQVEWLNFSGGSEAGGGLQRTGRSGGMPLDLRVGESRSFSVTESVQDAGQPQARVTAQEQRIKLVSIGALDTQAGRFPLTCHIEETSSSRKRPTQSWYAPGYGVVKTEVRLADNAVRTLEAIEIQQPPY